MFFHTILFILAALLAVCSLEATALPTAGTPGMLMGKRYDVVPRAAVPVVARAAPLKRAARFQAIQRRAQEQENLLSKQFVAPPAQAPAPSPSPSVSASPAPSASHSAHKKHAQSHHKEVHSPSSSSA